MTTKADRYVDFDSWLLNQIQTPEDIGGFLGACILEDNVANGLYEVIRANATKERSHYAIWSIGFMMEHMTADEIAKSLDLIEVEWSKELVMFYRQTLEDLKKIQQIVAEGGSVRLESIERSYEKKNSVEYQSLKEAIAC